MSLPYEDDTFDAVITDPPYYDSVQYGDLSDFFYVWVKRSDGFLYEDQFATPLTPKSEEIVSKRLGRNRPGAVMADEFERRLGVAFKELRRVVKPTGVAAIVFAHTKTAAWEALIRTLIRSQWVVTTSWPIRSEMAARSRAHGQPSLASSVCLVCQPRQAEETGFFDDVRQQLEARLRDRLQEFWDLGLSGADFFISAIGPAIEVFGKYRDVVKLSGESVGVDELLDLTQQVVADFTLTHLLEKVPLGAIDEPSRFYLFWRWAFVTASVPADDAYKLAHAFGVELDRLTGRRGFVIKAADKVSLNGPHARPGLSDEEQGHPALIIDVLHRALLLWEAGRRRELEELLAAHEVDQDPAFWAVAQALAELLPVENDEKMLCQGLTGAKRPLAERAARLRPTDQMSMEI